MAADPAHIDRSSSPTLVIDASAAVASLLAGVAGFSIYQAYDLIAPPLLWPEMRSALHQIAWRGDLNHDEVNAAHDRVVHAPIRVQHPEDLGSTAWMIADEYGWAKTYDAEYLALGQLSRSVVVTLERRLRQRVNDVSRVIGPTELVAHPSSPIV